jgi:hypothetical protein
LKKLTILAALLTSLASYAVGVNGTSANLTVQNANSNTGACTALSCAQMALQSSSGTIYNPGWSVQNTVSVNISGTFSATVTFQASYDEGATWNNFPCAPALTTATNLAPLAVSSATAAGNWVCDAGGATTFRAVASTLSSGTVAVILEGYNAVGGQTINALPLLSDSQQRIVSGASSGVSYNYTTLVPVPGSAGSLAAVEADGTNRLYLRRLTVCLDGGGIQGTAGPRKLVVFPTTAASSGGATTQIPVKIDAANAAYGGLSRFNSSGVITTTPAIGSVAEAQALDEFSLFLSTASTALNPNMCADRKYDGTSGLQPIAVPKAVANGIAVGDLSGGAGNGGNYVITMQFSTEPK